MTVLGWLVALLLFAALVGLVRSNRELRADNERLDEESERLSKIIRDFPAPVGARRPKPTTSPDERVRGPQPGRWAVANPVTPTSGAGSLNAAMTAAVAYANHGAAANDRVLRLAQDVPR